MTASEQRLVRPERLTLGRYKPFPNHMAKDRSWRLLCRHDIDRQKAIHSCERQGPPNTTPRQRISAVVIGRGAQEIVYSAVFGAPDRIRTCGLCLRRAALYPAELRVRGARA